jgi:nucleoside-diphosphate-sugar epimerase
VKILLTGSTGRVGLRLLPRLLDAGHEVRVLLRDRGSARIGAGIETCLGDLLVPSTLRAAVADVDAVVHLAAFFRGQDLPRIQSVNIEGTRNLATAALDANPKVRMVFTSTSLVYDSITSPAREDDATAPNAAYPASKVAAEQLLTKLHVSAGLDVRILRLAFVYGEGDSHLNEAGALFERWKWHPASRLHLVHHVDVAQAVLLLLTKADLSGQIFNVADDAPITAQEILAFCGQTAALADAAAPLEKPWRNLIDIDRIRAIGYRPVFPSLYTAAAGNGL